MEQTIERGILSDPTLIGQYLFFSALVVAESADRILLRNVREKRGRFERDHAWIPKIDNIHLSIDGNGRIKFRAKLVCYQNENISFKVDHRWTSVRGSQKLLKFTFRDVKLTSELRREAQEKKLVAKLQWAALRASAESP
jgi:hypothetical protein